jgi:hypothetical protein
MGAEIQVTGSPARVSSMRSTSVTPPRSGPAAVPPTSTTSPTKRTWLPSSIRWRTAQSSHAGARARIGEPVTASITGSPFSAVARPAPSWWTSATGLTNRRTTARSSRSSRLIEKVPLSDTSRHVLAVRSMETPTSLGSTDTCTTRLAVIRLNAHCPPRYARLPIRNKPVGIDHRTRRRARSYSS